MKVNLFTGYCPSEMYGLSRYDRNLFDNLLFEKELVCMRSRYFFPFDIIRYRFIQHPKADINHVTNETFAFVLGAIKGKKVATIFDMGVLVLNDEYGPIQRLFYMLNLNELRKADYIITSSKFTRDLLVEKFGFDKNKISVIYLGIEQKFILSPKKLEKKDCYQIIYVGNEKLHKNFMQVLEVMKILKAEGNFRLVKVGRPSSKNREMHMKFAEKNGLNVKFLDYISDEELVKIYRQSDVFITMSDYEGFCFPPLEAAACGIPIVLKDSPTLKEIYREIGHMVHNPKEAADQILELISSKSKYNQSASRANEYAKKFTWEKCAKEVGEVYKKIL